MPQLDQLTFLSQYFWLCVFFIGFYIILLKNFLPKMSRIFKLRQKKTNTSLDDVSNSTTQFEIRRLNEKNMDVNLKYDQLIIDALKKSRNFFIDSLVTTSGWLNQIVKNTNNKTKLKKMNKNYLASLGLINFSKDLTLNNYNKICCNYPIFEKSSNEVFNYRLLFYVKMNLLARLNSPINNFKH